MNSYFHGSTVFQKRPETFSFFFAVRAGALLRGDKPRTSRGTGLAGQLYEIPANRPIAAFRVGWKGGDKKGVDRREVHQFLRNCLS